MVFSNGQGYMQLMSLSTWREKGDINTKIGILYIRKKQLRFL